MLQKRAVVRKGDKVRCVKMRLVIPTLEVSVVWGVKRNGAEPVDNEGG